MIEDRSNLGLVKPDPGKYQWVKGKVTGTDDKQAGRTHIVGIPHLMPGIVIFVHRVNSDGEWYFDASGSPTPPVWRQIRTGAQRRDFPARQGQVIRCS
jgi:hypothetical protein